MGLDLLIQCSVIMGCMCVSGYYSNRTICEGNGWVTVFGISFFLAFLKGFDGMRGRVRGSSPGVIFLDCMYDVEYVSIYLSMDSGLERITKRYPKSPVSPL